MDFSKSPVEMCDFEKFVNRINAILLIDYRFETISAKLRGLLFKQRNMKLLLLLNQFNNMI